MPDASKAIFLSYASQDAEAARTICEALRSGGVEVWFDVEGGLEHGDEWDAKIRKQIKECVLFIAVISANTQARHEGYFRIEWDLAAERARGIASGVAFILPVLIDDTRESDALVPDRFRAVQWTKLPGGVVTPEVKARYLKLWSHRTGSLAAQASSPASSIGAGGPPALPRNSQRTVIVAGLVAVVAVVALGLLVFQGGRAPIAPEASTRGASMRGAVAAGSEIDQFVQQARAIIYDPDSGRAEFALAENFLKRATDLAPASGAAWGASALLQHYFYSRSYDANKQRLVRSQSEAEKTLHLDPRNSDALLALGLHRQALREYDRAQDYLERARAADPQNSKVIRALSTQLPDRRARAKFLLDAAPTVSRPAELFYYAALDFIGVRRFDEAAHACDRAIAAQPFWRSFVMRANIEKLQSADPAKITAWLNRVPELKRDEPRVALLRSQAAMLQRDYAAAVRVLSGVAVDYFEDNFFFGPKAFLLAPADELAGQPGRAAEQWQLAERSIREKLEADPTIIAWRAMLAVILAGQKRAPEAQAIVERCAADERIATDVDAMEYTAEVFLRLGDSARAIEWLRRAAATRGWAFVSAATLGVDPRWDRLRTHPEYGALLALLKRSETDDPAPSLPTVAVPAPEKSVAVLAFRNLSDAQSGDYFSDGLSEELGNVLGRVPGLRVAGSTSAFSFKGKAVTLPDIARQLGVAYLVEGSVQREGSDVRITAKLINGADGLQVWTSGNLKRKVESSLALQEEIAGLIAKELSLKLGVASAASTAAVNPRAFELYLQGRQAWNLRTPAGYDRAEALFVDALKFQPDFARAHVGLADVWLLRDEGKLTHFAARNAPEYTRIEAKLNEARALDPDLPELLATTGELLTFRWRFDEALAQLDQAILRNPNYYPARLWRARHLMLVGRVDEALTEIKLATAADPLAPRALSNAAMLYAEAGRMTEALNYADRALALQPDSFQASIWKAEALLGLGRERQALEWAQANIAARPFRAKTFTFIFARSGQRAEAADAFGPPANRPRVNVGYSHLRGLLELGRKGEALAAFEAETLGKAELEWIFYAPIFDQIRLESRFAEQLAKVGLTEAHARAQAWRAAHPPEKVDAKK